MLLPSWTVEFLQAGVGGVLSLTVILATQLRVLPLPSLAVTMTEKVLPASAQVTVEIDVETKFTCPQLSFPPKKTSFSVRV